MPQVFKDFPNLVRLQALKIWRTWLLKKAGFLKEGVLRKYTFIKGEIKDLVVFSFLSTGEIPSVD